MGNLTFFGFLFTAWGVVTFGLGLLLVYRATVAMKEEDILFLNPAEASLVEGQNQIQRQLAQLRPYLLGLGVVSASLFVAMGAFITYSLFA